MEHAEGRARWAFQKYLNWDSAYSWQYDFYEKDHLGNTRARYSWDNGEYARDQTIKFILPWQFLFMCKLTDVTPDEVLDRFMNDLGQESWKRRENDAVRQTLVDYFVLCGYGQKWYTEQEIRKMFKELDAIGSLWPENSGIKLIHRHARWKERYQAPILQSKQSTVE